MKIRPRFVSITAAFVCAVAFLLSARSGLAQQPLHMLDNKVPAAVSSGQATLVGRLPATQKMQLTIVLQLSNQEALTTLLSQIYDPFSPNYRHFLSVDQFTAQFSPTAKDYQTVVNFARANGFTVTDTSANRLIVRINGTVAQVEKAFNVRMNTYNHPTEKRTFFSPDREPSLNLSVAVTRIVGLDNFTIPRPALAKAAAVQAIPAITGSGPGGSYLGSDMRAAYYGGSALTGNGQAVGLLEFGGYNLSDVISTFSNARQSYSVPINNILLDGVTGEPNVDDTEEVLDIVQAISMAPGLSQVRVYIGSSDVDIFNQMATENLCKQLSVSWAWGPEDAASDDLIFQEFAA
jgi:subtilase family serine protease